VSVADSVGIVVGGLCTAETAVLTAVMAFLNFPAEARSLLGRSEMNARHVIDSASFGPEALKAIGEAFDGRGARSQVTLATTHATSNSPA
jgi:hypothetical protein